MICLVCAGSVMSQKDAQFSQFIFNKLAFNPAYTGAKEALTLASVYRHQWQGIEGAPRTIGLYTHAPFAGNRNGLGLSITSDQIGFLDDSYIDLYYAYRIPFRNRSTLSLGLQARFSVTRIDWEKAEVVHLGDNFIPEDENNRTNLNFGLGLYYEAKSFYVGFSVPQLLKNNLYSEEFIGVGGLGQYRNYYFMAGVIAPVAKSIMFKPGMLISYSRNTPFELAVNASFLFVETLWIGATYRLGDSIDGVVQYQFGKQLKVGVAVDFTLSELRKYTAGSLELIVEYLFDFDKQGVNNIRFF